MRDRLLTTTEAAKRLGISPRRVLALIYDKRLPAQQWGRDWLIREADLAQVERRPVGRPRKGEGR